jgi:hypothetical protein
MPAGSRRFTFSPAGTRSSSLGGAAMPDYSASRAAHDPLTPCQAPRPIVDTAVDQSMLERLAMRATAPRFAGRRAAGGRCCHRQPGRRYPQ